MPQNKWMGRQLFVHWPLTKNKLHELKLITVDFEN